MKLIKYAAGAIIGAAAGFVAGVLLAPRSGAESRAMASDAVNDAWDSAVDTYERGQQAVNSKLETMRAKPDATTDELRAKVDLARERMDQLRDSMNGAAQAADAEVEEDAVEPITPEIVYDEVTEAPAETDVEETVEADVEE